MTPPPNTSDLERILNYITVALMVVTMICLVALLLKD